MSLTIDAIAKDFPDLSVLTGEDSAARPLAFGSSEPNPAKGIARPRTTDELAALLKACNEAGQPVIMGGGMTNMAGATMAREEDLIISTELMSEIIEINTDDRVAVVEAGAKLQDVQEAAAKHGLALEADLGARGSATIGGMVSTNAGGNRVLRYGMMREQVFGMEVVLADGTVLSSMNRVLKNNAAYDLKQLFIGSEGTLGAVTKVVLRLRELPPHITTLFLALPSYDAVCKILRHLDRGTGGTLSTFEVMWQNYYRLVSTSPAEGVPPLSQDYPFYVLAEMTGQDAETTEALALTLLESASEEGLVVDGLIAKNEAEREKLWAMRDDIGQVLQLYPIAAFDISVPLSRMPQYLEHMDKALHAEFPSHRSVIFGHLGDSNIHVIVGSGTDDEADLHRIEELVYDPLPGVGGTISAEHGIGVLKKDFLHLSRTPEEIAIMKKLKGLFDPKAILNRGKVFDL